ncbi:hypothetical protein Pmani_012603 [Petrolisthes manimaculis]|uniref:Uncharacterized protein n=1 Tax=Petrolisthes manimaculis TaxID=1843537 RepID=A0AAE1PY98_9EUCA|nr:hypothetical protein Pmani_012603 [Petrolisthes manimaculis]
MSLVITRRHHHSSSVITRQHPSPPVITRRHHHSSSVITRQHSSPPVITRRHSSPVITRQHPLGKSPMVGEGDRKGAMIGEGDRKGVMIGEGEERSDMIGESEERSDTASESEERSDMVSESEERSDMVSEDEGRSNIVDLVREVYERSLVSEMAGREERCRREFERDVKDYGPGDGMLGRRGEGSSDMTDMVRNVFERELMSDYIVREDERGGGGVVMEDMSEEERTVMDDMVCEENRTGLKDNNMTGEGEDTRVMEDADGKTQDNLTVLTTSFQD